MHTFTMLPLSIRLAYRHKFVFIMLMHLGAFVAPARAQDLLHNNPPCTQQHIRAKSAQTPDGNLIVACHNGETEIYRLKADTCYTMARLPFSTEDAAFSHAGDKLFLLHSRSFWGARLTTYDTRSWSRISTRSVSSRSNALSVNANDSVVGISEGPLIRILNSADLRTARVYWETRKQRLLVFNPVLPSQVATVTPQNIIQVRDLAQDTILAEIGAHDAPVVWLEYHAGGTLLVSLDAQGDLFAWSLPEKRCVLQSRQVRQVPTFDGHGVLRWRSADTAMVFDPAQGRPSVTQDTVKSRSYFLNKVQKPFEIFPQPVITYLPETGVLVGASAGLLFYPGSLMRYPPYYWPSVITPSVMYGLGGKQLRTSVTFDIYERSGWHWTSALSYNMKERNYYFGIGGNADKDERQYYTLNAFGFTGTMIRNITNWLKVGIGYSLRHYTPPAFEKEAVTHPGAEGGWLTGAGPAIQIDHRSDMVFPTRGSLLDASFYRYWRVLDGDFSYNEAMVNYRKYFPVNGLMKGSVLAMQCFVHATWGGDAPFYQLPYLTADRVLRGVWRNLYIDRQVAYVQAEFRSYMAHGDTRYGYVLFAGAGDGAGNFLKDYDPDVKVVYGAGYRQQLVPKLRLDFRIDFAFTSEGNFGIYGGAGVAF